MIKHGQPMSQTLAQMHLNELKMNDPKLNKVFDKLKKGDKVKLKTSSTISQGKDFVEYIVKSKNVVNKGKVEKITLATVGNEKAVKKFLYRRDGKVTFAIGDMGASIDDIKEKYSLINHELIEEIEVEELDEAKYNYDGKVVKISKKEFAKVSKDYKNTTKGKERMMILDPKTQASISVPVQFEEVEDLDEMDMKYVLINMQGKVQGYASDEKDALDIARRTKSTMHKIKKKISDKTLEKMNALAKTPKELQDLGIIEGAADDARRSMSKDRDLVRRGKDSADVDDTASDTDKKSAMKNMIMQMRQSLDSKGSKPIEFEDGKKQKVDPKILTLLTKAHDQIQKPRDKEQFVKMISKSYRDMLKVSKMVGKQLRMGEGIKLDEGTWKMPDNPKEIAALKKLMSRPLPIGNTEDEKMYKDSASSKLYGLLGDDELFDALGELEDKGKEKADARPVIIKWFRQRAKDDSYGLGDETKDLGKQIGLKMEYIPEGFSPKEIKMAIGIASDPRYKQGNYSGAVKQIEKIKKGLSTHKQVAAVLKRQNESNRVDNFDENYRKLAMQGIGTETKKAAKVGLKTDYYLPKNGDKSFGKITRVSSSGYEITDEKTKKVHKFKFYDPNNDPTSVRGTREEVELDEKSASKSATGYDIYHKDFSSAMQHATAFAKKKGQPIKKDEIDSKVATGPKKPSKGKENSYNLETEKGKSWSIQVYNMDDKKYELNMYLTSSYVPEELTNESIISKKGGQLQRVIDSIVVLMKKDPKMKKHAMDFARDAKKTEDPRESLDNVTDLPFGNYAVGDKIGDILNKNEPIGHMVGRGKTTPVYRNKNPRARVNEENQMTKSLKDTIVEMWSEAVSPAQQAAIAISKKEKEEQDEGNAFTKALKDARENGDKTFVVAGKTYSCEDYDENGEMKEFVQADGVKRRVKEGDNRLKANKTETNKNNKSDDGDGMDAVQPKAVKKKFKDRIDKDIDNDGDVDDSDKFLHKRRKAVSKAIKGESIERYHETKKGSLRDAVLQMWGESVKEEKEKKSLTKEKKDGSVKKMTDTGKEVTPVETSVKMPKIKETNNKV